MIDRRARSPLDLTLERVSAILQTASRAPRRPLPRPQAAVDPPGERRRHIAGLMRVNHAGEVAAQALYHGQALVARDRAVRAHLLQAAAEERDHLEWCRERLQELGARPSRLHGLWYGGSFAIGAAAGLAGDRWSLGFVEETERQVSAHLDEHLAELADLDAATSAIIRQMRADEQRHGEEAARAGGRTMPGAVRALMRQAAGFMKRLAYRF